MSRTSVLLFQIVVGLCGLLAWHVVTAYPVVSDVKVMQFFFSTPRDVIERVYQELLTVSLWEDLGITLVEMLLAFITGAVGGVAFGFLFARKELMAAVFDPYIKGANAIPRILLAPIFTLWFGLGITSKVAFGFTVVFFVVFFNIYRGVRDADRNIVANARMLGMNERMLLRHVYWPTAMTWLFSSLHTALGFALISVVIAEYLGSVAGLGYRIQRAQGVFDITGVFAGMVILSLVVVILDWMITNVEARLLSWQPAAASTAAT